MFVKLNARQLLSTILPIVLLFSTSCGKGGSSADIEISVAPTQPIVISTDIELADETVSAPWIYAALRVKNNSSKVLSVLVIRFDSKGTLDGAPVGKEVEYTQDDETKNGILIQARPGQTFTLSGYFGGLVKTTNDAFSVRATMIGWFSEDDEFPDVYNPNERFEKTFSFYAK